jgi:hypothetical protein
MKLAERNRGDEDIGFNILHDADCHHGGKEQAGPIQHRRRLAAAQNFVANELLVHEHAGSYGVC